jgi:aminoglycoside 6'-N-acetyltransferase
VAAWWRERPDITNVNATFGPRVDGVEPTRVFLIEGRGRPLGWIQWYYWADYTEHALQLGVETNAAGLDLAIGERTMLGVGLGPAAIREFLARIVFADPRVNAVVTDPEERNAGSLRAFQKAGFTVTKTLQLAGEDVRRCVVRLDRPGGIDGGSSPEPTGLGTRGGGPRAPG